MKKQSNYPLTDICKQLVENLNKGEKNETLAVGFLNNKTFSTVDLWNIQRQRKPRVEKRMLSLANL